MSGASLKNYNYELVKSIEDMRERREELNRQILKEEEERAKVEQELHRLHDLMNRLTEGLNAKISTRNEYDKTIQETEQAYVKILESSQTLLHVLGQEKNMLGKKKEAAQSYSSRMPTMPSSMRR